MTTSCLLNQVVKINTCDEITAFISIMADAGSGNQRVSNFLLSCRDAKKLKRDFDSEISAKKAQKRRIDEQIHRLKAQILKLTTTLKAKEAVLDSLDVQISMLATERDNAASSQDDTMDQ